MLRVKNGPYFQCPPFHSLQYNIILTFSTSQVLALVTHPPLLESDEFPEDAKDRSFLPHLIWHFLPNLTPCLCVNNFFHIICRARAILAGCKGGSVGSYSDSPGIEVRFQLTFIPQLGKCWANGYHCNTFYWQIIRRHVAEYIEQRDGMPAGYAGENKTSDNKALCISFSDWKNIILCAGASEVSSFNS